jgi:adenylate kinase
MRLVFLGPPGSGKGTQAKKMVERYGLAHIATGDILRKAIKDKTGLGVKAGKFVDDGELVPDEIILGIIKEELTEKTNGFIFDGFPRTLVQAVGLDGILSELGLNLDYVISFKIADGTIIDRLVSRRLCKKCGFEFNLKTRPPKVEGVCDRCGGELYQRTDDTVDVINNRLSVYREKTKPIEDYYKKKGILIEVDGGKDFGEVFGSITEMVGAGE